MDWDRLIEVFGPSGVTVAGLMLAIKYLAYQWQQKDRQVDDERQSRIEEYRNIINKINDQREACEEEKAICLQKVVEMQTQLGQLVERVTRAVENNTTVLSRCVVVEQLARRNSER